MMAKSSLLEQIKWFTIVDIAEDYELQCDTAEEFKELTEIVYQDLVHYEGDAKIKKQDE